MPTSDTPAGASSTVRRTLSGDHSSNWGMAARLRTTPEPDGEGAAAGVDHRVAQHVGPGVGAGQRGPAGPGRQDGLEHGRVLQHRPEVHRRRAGQVDEPGRRSMAAWSASNASRRVSTGTGRTRDARAPRTSRSACSTRRSGRSRRPSRSAAPRPRPRRSDVDQHLVEACSRPSTPRRRRGPAGRSRAATPASVPHPSRPRAAGMRTARTCTKRRSGQTGVAIVNRSTSATVRPAERTVRTTSRDRCRPASRRQPGAERRRDQADGAGPVHRARRGRARRRRPAGGRARRAPDRDRRSSTSRQVDTIVS